MSANHRIRTTLVAVGFTVAMMLLGLMNPNATAGWHACGLVCDASVTTSLDELAGR